MMRTARARALSALLCSCITYLGKLQQHESTCQTRQMSCIVLCFFFCSNCLLSYLYNVTMFLRTKLPYTCSCTSAQAFEKTSLSPFLHPQAKQ
jgi:hypothetical protein